MKKHLLIILIAVLFLHGCADKTELKAEKLLSMEELNSLKVSKSEKDFDTIIKGQQKLLLEMSDDEIIKNLKDRIDQWLAQETKGEILDYEITFTSDYLRIDHDRGVKIFNPFSLNLDFRYDTKKYTQITEEMKENLSRNLPNALRNTLVGFFAIYDLTLTTSGESGIFLSSEHVTLLPHQVDLLQSNEEKKLLELLNKTTKEAYQRGTHDEISQALSNMILDRFGMKKDSSELIAEFTITDVSNTMDVQEIKQRLSKSGDELFQEISRDEEVAGFLKQQGIKQFRITYSLPALSGKNTDNYEFTYDFTY